VKRKRSTMAGTAKFTIGAEVSCSDGVCGEVRRVVVDPVAEAVTHLVVGPEHPHGLGRLVPVDLIEATGEIRLRCTRAEFARLGWAKETHFLPKSGVYSGYAPGQVFSWPYYGVGGRLGPLHTGNLQQTVTYHSVPLGEVEIRRGQHVHAADGDIGRVQGLVIDRESFHVTHVLLQEGHLWGHREVAIPISAVASTSDGIQLRISKRDVQDLPPVGIDDPDGSTSGQAGHR
jgi:sporulation protein YlmC with PRC-barrel domain